MLAAAEPPLPPRLGSGGKVRYEAQSQVRVAREVEYRRIAHSPPLCAAAARHDATARINCASLRHILPPNSLYQCHVLHPTSKICHAECTAAALHKLGNRQAATINRSATTSSRQPAAASAHERAALCRLTRIACERAEVSKEGVRRWHAACRSTSPTAIPAQCGPAAGTGPEHHSHSWHVTLCPPPSPSAPQHAPPRLTQSVRGLLRVR